MSNSSDFVIKENELTGYVGNGGIVEIPEGVEIIGWGAFRNRADVTDVIIPEGVKEIFSYAFEGCKELQKVTIPASVTDIGTDAFAATACYRDSANWKKNVFYLGDALIKARASLSGSYNVEAGTRLIADNAFLKCDKLTAVSIPSSVMTIGDSAFCACSALTDLLLPDTVEYIGFEAFSSCGSLVSVRIPGSVKSIGKYAFSHCETLTEAEFAEGASMVGDAMFSNCKMLRRVAFPTSMREVNRNAFEYCGELTEICVAEDNEWFFAANGALILRDSRELYLAPRGIKGHYEISREVRSIGEDAFGGEHLGAGCSGMTEVTIPETITQIATRAFQCCNGLTNVTIPGSVVNIGESAFSLCTNMLSVTLQEGVKEIGKNAFFRCDKLKTITIPASVEYLHSQAFAACPEIESFEVSPDHKALRQMNGVVFSRDGSRLLLCPRKLAGTYRIPNGVKEISSSAFADCRELTELVLPRGILALPDQAFYGCSRLNKATVFNDYPSDNIGRLFGFYGDGYRSHMRENCLVKICDAQTDAVCFEVLLATESNGIGYTLRQSVWGKNASFDFNKLDSLFDSYKEMTNRLLTAYLRLKYPLDLDDAGKDKYQKFIKRNGIKLLPELIAGARADMIGDFLEYGAVSKAKIDALIEQATVAKNPEITTMLMEYKRKHYGESKASFALSDKANKLWESKKDRPELLWRYNGTDRELTLPTELDGKSIIGVSDTVLKKPDNYQNIEKLVIPEGYRSIGKDAFSGCRNLREVIFPSTLESLGENCFFGCVSLKHIELPDTLTNWGAGSFANCSALEDVRLPARVQSIPAQAFMQCEKLKTIVFPETLCAIGREAFRYCPALKEIDLGENVSFLGDRCFYLTKLETVIIRGKKCYAGDSPCFEYPRYVYTDGEVQAIGLPQASRMPLSYLGLKNGDLVESADKDLLSGLTVYGYGKLKAFPKIDDYRYSNMVFGEFVTALGGICSSTMKKAVDLIVVYEIDPEDSIIQRAQKQGTAIITELDFLKAIQKNEKLDLDALRAAIGEIAVQQQSDDPFRPALMKIIWKYTELEDGTISLDSYLEKETSVLIPPRIGDKPVSVIGEKAFSPEGPHVLNRAGKKAICSVTIPEGVKVIGGYAFYGCRELESVSIPESVTSIGRCAFENCSSLKEVIIPNGVKKIGWWTFYGCKSLTDVTIPASVTEIDNEAFTSDWMPSCGAVIHAPSGSCAEQFAKEKNIQFAVLEDVTQKARSDQEEQSEPQSEPLSEPARHDYDIDGTVLVKYHGPGGIVEIPEGISAIGVSAFESSDVASVTIPESVKEIGGRAFAFCKKLKSIKLSAGLNYIGNHAFYKCTGLTSIMLPNGITTIGDYVFRNSGLKNVLIPASVETIGEGAFSACSDLLEIQVEAGSTAFHSVDGVLFQANTASLIGFPGGKTGAYVIPNGITNIATHAFSACSKLTDITIPAGVKHIRDWAFCDCTHLTKVAIPSSVTRIGEGAFYGCSELTGMEIPKAVKTICKDAFALCPKLKIHGFAGSAAEKYAKKKWIPFAAE